MFNLFNPFNIFKKNKLSKANKFTDTTDQSDTIKSIDNLERVNYDLQNIHGHFFVEKVYDGDTIYIRIPMKISVYQMVSPNTFDIHADTNPLNEIKFYFLKVRLYGIDTPEIKPSLKLPNREEHIAKAKKAKDFLSELVLNKIVEMEFLKNDLYGRVLAKLFIKDHEQNKICINDLMVSEGYAKPYFGQKKDSNFT